MKDKVTIIAAILSLLTACGSLGRAEQGGESERASGTGLYPTHGGGAVARVPHEGLRIATWNLEWLNEESGKGPVKRSDEDYARLRRYATALAADIVAFQEVDGRKAAERVFDPAEYELHVAAQNDPQRTGFAYRRTLAVTIHPDYTPLDVGQVRAGADLTVERQGRRVRLLSVHLKSGCFQDALSSEKKDCKKLALQVPALEAWIDARASEGVAAVVLGDFNRRLFASKPDELWAAIDDADPPLSDLWSPTEGRAARCWGGAHPVFIDHIVLNQPATQLVVQGSFEERLYDAGDAAFKRVLSDHCPLALTLGPSAQPVALVSGQAGAALKIVDAGKAVAAASALRIKGNISSSGRRLFHAPDCPDYERTQIDESKGERWFESVAEAEAAGWAKPINCP